MNFFVKVSKDRTEKTDPIQSARIIALTNQTESVDYYDIEIEGKYFKDVPCPIPEYLRNILKNDFDIGMIITENRKVSFDRKPLYNANDNIEVSFVKGNRHMPKISLEASREKYEPIEIVYI